MFFLTSLRRLPAIHLVYIFNIGDILYICMCSICTMCVYISGRLISKARFISWKEIVWGNTLTVTLLHKYNGLLLGVGLKYIAEITHTHTHWYTHLQSHPISRLLTIMKLEREDLRHNIDLQPRKLSLTETATLLKAAACWPSKLTLRCTEALYYHQVSTWRCLYQFSSVMIHGKFWGEVALALMLGFVWFKIYLSLLFGLIKL